MSTVLEIFAMRGVAISGIVYVPIPAYVASTGRKKQLCQSKTGVESASTYLIIDELSGIVLDKHAEKLDNVGVLVGRVRQGLKMITE